MTDVALLIRSMTNKEGKTRGATPYQLPQRIAPWARSSTGFGCVKANEMAIPSSTCRTSQHRRRTTGAPAARGCRSRRSWGGTDHTPAKRVPPVSAGRFFPVRSRLMQANGAGSVREGSEEKAERVQGHTARDRQPAGMAHLAPA